MLSSTTVMKLSTATAALLGVLGASWLLLSRDASAGAIKPLLLFEAQLVAEDHGAQLLLTETAYGRLYVVVENAERSEPPASDSEIVDADAAAASATPSAGSEGPHDPEGSTMTIVVTDSEGRRLSRAKIFQNHVYLPEGTKEPKIKNHEYLTDAQGKVVITWPGDSEDLRLWVSKSGYVPLHAMWARRLQADGDEPPTEFQFELSNGTSIGGVVTDEEGRPIAGARIEINNVSAALPITPDQPGERPVPVNWLAEGESAIVTDEQGRWTAQNIPSDAKIIKRIADQHAWEHRRRARFNNGIARFPQDSPPVPIRLRVSHADYNTFDAVENPMLYGQPTFAELRNQDAAIVLHRRGGADEENEIE